MSGANGDPARLVCVGGPLDGEVMPYTGHTLEVPETRTTAGPRAPGMQPLGTRLYREMDLAGVRVYADDDLDVRGVVRHLVDGYAQETAEELPPGWSGAGG